MSPGHAERTRIRFERDAFPYIGRRLVAEIEAPELLGVLRRVTARGAVETAHRLKDACGQVFRYGIASGGCARNPAADLRDALPPVHARHHAAIGARRPVGRRVAASAGGEQQAREQHGGPDGCAHASSVHEARVGDHARCASSLRR